MVKWFTKLKTRILKPKTAAAELTVTVVVVGLLRALIAKGIVTEDEVVDQALKAKEHLNEPTRGV